MSKVNSKGNKGKERDDSAKRLALAETMGTVLDVATATHKMAERIESPLLKSTAQALALVMTAMRRSPNAATFWMLLGTTVQIHELAAIGKFIGPEMMTHELDLGVEEEF